MPSPHHANRLIRLPSTLAIWPACYTLGVYLLVLFALGLSNPSLPTVAAILLIAHACYLFDRAKLSDARQDPADALALPERSLFYAKFATPIRALIVLELVTASMLSFSISALLSLLPLGALIGVYHYAGRGATPSKPRIKDIPGLKSFLIAGAHVALVFALLWGEARVQLSDVSVELTLMLTGIWLIVASDATLCDLDDRLSDAIYSTRSVPVIMGDTRAWIVAQALLLIGAALVVLLSERVLPALWLMLGLIIAGIPTAWIKNRRDLIDARLLPILLLALLIA